MDVMLSDIIRKLRALPRCQFISTALQILPKETILRIVNVILRIPALFILEVWLKTDPSHIRIPLLDNQNEDRKSIVNSAIQSTGTHDFVVFALYYIGLLFAIALATIPLEKLVRLYTYVVSGGLIIGAHYCSSVYLDEEQSSEYEGSVLENHDSLRRAGIHAVVQCIISALISYLLNLNRVASLSTLVYVLPMCARITGYPISSLHRVHNFSCLFEMIVVTIFFFNVIPKVLDLIKSYLQYITLTIQLYGWMPLAIAMWSHRSLPVQFFIFWTSLLTVQFYKYFTLHDYPEKVEGWLLVILASIAESIVTPISLIGVCITISYVAFCMLTCTKIFLQGRDAFIEQGNMMQRGWTEGFTMFLLAVQTDLIRMKTAHRAFLMSIILFIVLSSLIQSIYEMTEPILLALGASQSKNVFKHIRAVFLATLLWILPLYMAATICRFFDMDFWLMVVISSCILTSVQVVGSLVTYALFMYDALRNEPWQKLDDVVYYTKATTRVLEFIVAVFVVCYGVHESLFGEWSWVNGMILIVHCYVNVWQRLQSGWKSYLLRREAVKKIESLPDATPDQLLEHNDICSICYQEMLTAKITACSHFFHATCLRKWLYVQEKCPLCHQNVSYPEAHTNGSSENEQQSPHEDIEGDSSDTQSEDSCSSFQSVSQESVHNVNSEETSVNYQSVLQESLQSVDSNSQIEDISGSYQSSSQQSLLNVNSDCQSENESANYQLSSGESLHEEKTVSQSEDTTDEDDLRSSDSDNAKEIDPNLAEEDKQSNKLDDNHDTNQLS